MHPISDNEHHETEVLGWDHEEDIDVPPAKDEDMMFPSSTPVNVGYSPDAPYLSMAHPSNESSSTLVRRHQKRTSARRKNSGPARPMNAFMCFRRDLGQKNKGKKLNVQQLSQMAGETWRDLSSEQKAVWKAMADELKAEHATMYPDYRFRPQRRDRSTQEGSDYSKRTKGSRTKPKPINKTIPEPKAHSSASPSSSAESQRSVSDGADMMFTAVDGLFSPVLDPVHITMHDLVHSISPETGNGSSQSDNQNNALRRSEYGVLDGQPIPELSPSTTTTSISDTDAADPGFGTIWDDFVPNLPQLSHPNISISNPQYPHLPKDTSQGLSPLEAVASSLWNDISGVLDMEEMSQPSTWIYPASQDRLDQQTIVIPEDLREGLARFVRDRELESGSDKIFSLKNSSASDNDHSASVSKQKTIEESHEAYDLEGEHVRNAFNVPGLNGMELNVRDLDTMYYPSPQSDFS